jgi:hypothetical protein
VRRALPPGFRIDPLRLKRLGLQFAILLEQYLDLAFGFLQLLAAGAGQLDTLLEQPEGALQGDVPFFELINDLFEPLKALFKLRQSLDLLLQIVRQFSGGEAGIFVCFLAATFGLTEVDVFAAIALSAGQSGSG